MRQYHPRSEEEEKRFPEKRQDYFLGKRPTPPSNTNIEYIVDDNDQGFLSMQYTDGTPCSITGNTPRKTEVHFHCVPGSLDTIVSVQETASCVYKVHIATSRLCNDDAFVAKTHELKGDSVVISCEDISGENHKIEGAYTGNSGLVLRQFANIDGGRFSLEKLYPEVVQRVVTAPSASLQILGQPTAILEDAALVNKVKEAISKLTAIDSNGKPYPGKLPTTKSATPPGNANEPIKVVELVIDENGNIVFDGDAETVLREFFGGTDVVANKLVGDRTIPAVDDQHDEFDRLHKEHLKQHSQQHQQNMDQHQQFLQEQEEAIQQFLHKQRLQQEIKRYQDQQKLSERRQQPESHLAANEEKAASESSSYSSSSSTSSSSTTSETFLDGVTVSKSVQAEIASKHTVTKDGEIIQEENYGAAASADSRHGVNGKNVPIEILTADGEEIDPKMLQKLLEMMQRAAGGTVTASSGTIRSSRSDDNESNDDGESESATVERRNKGTTDSGDAETQLTEKLQKQRKGEEL
ncbi:Protein OS-9 [Physocladia obscura]|uniref:Protein OS-9 homolog n=1 Tax=Physocladia obscura TaxID=109957 RepID=A0AAD5XK66_9FUNG|nr:Protein OS-9 [Physocladia obscura]